MSYEREAMPSGEGSTGVVQASMPTMREERILTPYEQRGPRLKPAGQPDMGTKATPVLEDSKPPEDAVRLSPQVAALARREQKFRQEQAVLARDRAAIAAEREEFAQLRAMKEKLAAKDYSALEGMVDYNDYSQYQVNKLNGTDPTQEELKRLSTKVQELEKFGQDNVEKQFEAAVQERRTAAQSIVDTGQFPKIKKAQAHEVIVQHILDTWEHDSQELTVEQAAKEVEEILAERALQWKALLEDEDALQAPEAAKKPLPPLKGSLKTLTNQVTSGDVKRIQKPLHLMSDAERYAEARRRAEDKLRMQGR